MRKLKLTKLCYKHAITATDIIILAMHQQVLSVLLIKMKKPPYQDCWAAPGGLARPDESVDDSALRNLEGTTGLKNIFLEQLYTFGGGGSRSLRQGGISSLLCIDTRFGHLVENHVQLCRHRLV